MALTPVGDIRGVRGPVWSGGFGLDDDRPAVADHDPLAGDSLELGGEVARPAVLVDASVAVTGAQLTEPGIRVAHRESTINNLRV